MTWKIREVSAIFVLLVAVTAAQSFCNTSMADTISASLLSGTVYPALVTDIRFGEGIEHYGGVLTAVKKNNEDWVSMDMYYTLPERDPTICEEFVVECQITDNTCRYEDGLHFFVMAHDDNYLVLYTPRGGDLYTLEIYARNFDREGPLTVGDLPDKLIEDIEKKCGDQYVKQSAFPCQFPPGNFIPKCQ